MSGEQVSEAGLDPPGWAARLSLAAFALLGHAFVLGLALAAVASAWGLLLLFRSISSGTGYLILFKLGLPLLVFAWCTIRALWLKIPPPDGILVERTDAPRLWAVIGELERDLRTPRVHRVYLYGEFNAEVGQYPRLGLLGWPRNVLFLGVPWLLTSTPEGARAGIAHELAHLSRRHNRTTRLVWRAYQSAERVQASLAATYQSSQLLTARFFNWYRPALGRRAVALSRAKEFEADHLAATAAGLELVGQDLIATEVCDALLRDQFWPKIDRRYERGEPCPQKIFQELREFLCTSLDVAGAEGHLTAALAGRSDPFSTHPSLAERLAALGIEPRLPELRPSVSAASDLFGDHLDRYLDRLSDEWRAAHGAAWDAHAKRLQEAKAEISALEGVAATHALEINELARLARLQELVHGRGAGSRQNLELLERNPDHLGASWRLGRAGLEAGHAHGVPLILRVMGRDWRAIPAGTSAIRDAA